MNDCFDDSIEKARTVAKADAHVPLDVNVLMKASLAVKRANFLYVVGSTVIPDDAYGILYVRPEDVKDWKK